MLISFFAGKRPPVEEIYKWLDRNRKWIVQKLFSGADPELIAHALAGKIKVKHLTAAIRLRMHITCNSMNTE